MSGFIDFLKEFRRVHKELSTESHAKSFDKAAGKLERKAARNASVGNKRTAGKAARNASALREAEERERAKS